MLTIILPGYSQKNEKWLEETAARIKTGGLTRPIYWDHWTEFGKKFNPEEKAQVIADLIEKDLANMIAKSIGTFVASLVIQKVPKKINRAVFCGIPLNDINDSKMAEIKNALEIFPADKVMVFQNAEDPHGSFEHVKTFVLAINPDIKVISKPREDHEYPYFEEFQDFLG